MGANLRGDLKSDGCHHQITNIGSENGVLQLYRCTDGTWLVCRGCFTGTKDEFITQVNEVHGDNEHGVNYRAIIDLFCVPAKS